MEDQPAEPLIRAEPADGPAGGALLEGWRHDLSRRYQEPLQDHLTPSATPEEMGPPGGAFLVLYVDGRPCACGGLKRLGEGTGEIKRMFVAPEARGQGHGRRILAALEDAARGLGYRRIWLDTGRAQHEAQSLYPSAGYRAIPAYNQNRYADFWFEKEL